MVRWVFMDLGGTLLDQGSEYAFHFRTCAELLTEHGIPTTPQEVRAQAERLIRDHAPAFVRTLLEERLGDPEAAGAILREVSRRHRGLAGELQPPYPEALSVLDDLRQTHRVGILANQPASIRSSLDASGISARADPILLSGEVGLAKPDAAFFRLALETVSCSGAEAAMVGDRIDNDVVPAKALGLRTVRVRSPEYAMQEARSLAEEPDLEVRRLAEVPLAIRRL